MRRRDIRHNRPRDRGPTAGGDQQPIADIRGYTVFTQERGDEAAAELARAFAGIARTGVEARGGSLVELRGDEALAVFPSARAAMRAAMELQAAFAEHTADQPDLPMRVGIGLDAGEAVQVDSGYRGGALNLAARLWGRPPPERCSRHSRSCTSPGGSKGCTSRAGVGSR